MLRWLTVPFVFALCLLLVNEGLSGEKKKKKKKAGGISGTVVSVEPVKDKDGKEVKDAWTLTFKVPGKKNKKTGAVVREAQDVKVALSAGTKIEKAARKKKQPAEPATVADLQPGQTVGITVNPQKTDEVEKVSIQARKKKKKNQ
jgi:hypothetical protein